MYAEVEPEVKSELILDTVDDVWNDCNGVALLQKLLILLFTVTQRVHQTVCNKMTFHYTVLAQCSCLINYPFVVLLFRFVLS